MKNLSLVIESQYQTLIKFLTSYFNELLQTTILTLPQHSDLKTFLEPAKLAPGSRLFCHLAVIVPMTSVLHPLLHRPPEEALLN